MCARGLGRVCVVIVAAWIAWIVAAWICKPMRPMSLVVAGELHWGRGRARRIWYSDSEGSGLLGFWLSSSDGYG